MQLQSSIGIRMGCSCWDLQQNLKKKNNLDIWGHSREVKTMSCSRELLLKGPITTAADNSLGYVNIVDQGPVVQN